MRGYKEKKENILFLLVKEYLETGQPVGSKTLVTKYSLDISPATVRNYFSSLEEEGYLNQLHPSSGRIPTNKALKFYINKVVERMKMASSLKIDRDITDLMLLDKELTIDAFLTHLSKLTNAISFFFYTVPTNEKIKNVHLIQCSKRKILFIIIGEDKVEEHIINSDDEIEEDILAEIKKYVLKWLDSSNDEFIEKWERIYPVLISEIRKVIDERRKRKELGEMYIKGIRNILNYEEVKLSKDIDTFISFMEDRDKTNSLINFLSEFKRLLVLLGEEAPELTFEKTVLINLPYIKDEYVEGGIGFFTPKRIDFERLFRLLERYAKRIKKALEQI